MDVSKALESLGEYQVTGGRRSGRQFAVLESMLCQAVILAPEPLWIATYQQTRQEVLDWLESNGCVAYIDGEYIHGLAHRLDVVLPFSIHLQELKEQAYE